MNFLTNACLLVSRLVADESFNDQGAREVLKEAYAKFKDIVGYVLPILLGVVLLAGVIYSIILGVNYSKAEEAEERKKAKDHLVHCIIGFGITLVLIAIIYAVLGSGALDHLFKTTVPATTTPPATEGTALGM